MLNDFNYILNLVSTSFKYLTKSIYVSLNVKSFSKVEESIISYFVIYLIQKRKYETLVRFIDVFNSRASFSFNFPDSIKLRKNTMYIINFLKVIKHNL